MRIPWFKTKQQKIWYHELYKIKYNDPHFIWAWRPRVVGDKIFWFETVVREGYWSWDSNLGGQRNERWIYHNPDKFSNPNRDTQNDEDDI